MLHSRRVQISSASACREPWPDERESSGYRKLPPFVKPDAAILRIATIVHCHVIQQTVLIPLRLFPKLSLSARQSVDRTDQSHSAGLGTLLRDRTFEPVLRVHPRPGRKEDSAPSGPSRSAPGLRMEYQGDCAKEPDRRSDADGLRSGLVA